MSQDLDSLLLHAMHGVSLKSWILLPNEWRVRVRCWDRDGLFRRGFYDAQVMPPVGEMRCGWVTGDIVRSPERAVADAIASIEKYGPRGY